MREYTIKHLKSDKVKKKIEVIEKWVKQFGVIWSRRVLYELVSHQLVKDTSDTQYIQVCELFQCLRHHEPPFIPYDWFEDRRTSVSNVGIKNGENFETVFDRIVKYWKRDSKSLQKYYVEVWTEKRLSEVTRKLLKQYEIGTVMGEGFIGDIPFHDAIERMPSILKKYKLPVKVFYISDFDCEGEHTFHLCKERLEPLGNIEVKKLFLTKEQIENKNYSFISNIGYKERINKLKKNPKKWKAHLTKEYVKSFFNKEGIVQYEFDQFPVDILNKILENTISRYISLKIIENTDKICRKEVAEWMDKHYVE